MLKQVRWAPHAAVLLSGVLLAGCGGADGEDRNAGGGGGSSTNGTPQAVSDDLNMNQDSGPVSVDVLDNDSFGADGPGDAPVVIVSDPDHGSATVNLGGTPNDIRDDTVSYDPDPGYSGGDNFTYRIVDGDGDTDTAQVDVTVQSTNGTPNAVNDSLTVDEDAGATAINVLSNDNFGSDGAGSTAIVITSGPSNGTGMVLDGGTPNDPTDDEISYQPDPGYSGGDSLRYRIEDSDGDRDSATLSIVVNAVGGGGDTPSASNDGLTVDEDAGPTNVDVLSNDSFGGDGPAGSAIVIASGPSNGTATVDEDGSPNDPTDDSIDYEPDPDFNGNDSFIYTIEDANGDTASATVSVTVNSIDDSPTASNDSMTVDEDDPPTTKNVLSNDDFGGDGPASSAIRIVSGPSNGTASVDDDGSPNDPTDDTVEYEPGANFNGSDSFRYRIADSDGDTATATVSVTVNAVNDTPSAVNDSLTVDEDDPATAANVLVNDSFGGDGPGTSAIAVNSGPSNGTAQVDNNGTGSDPTDDDITYEPDPGYNGSDSFTYTIEDANGDTDNATVNVTVNAAGSTGGIVYVKASNTEAGDRFGGALGSTVFVNEVSIGGESTVLSADGSTLAVGAPLKDTGAGQVFVFTQDGSGNWSQQATFQAPNAGGADRFGNSLALSANGNTLAVGALGEDSSNDTLGGDNNSAVNSGAAYVFTRSGSTWSLQEYIKASDRAGGDLFGTSVALAEDGNTLAVGAIGQDTGTGEEGMAYLFTRSSGNWTQRDTVVSDSPEGQDLFGFRVELSANGSTLAVGSQNDGDGTPLPIAAGAVFVYTEGPSNNWQFQQEIVQPSPSAGSRFGSALALSDNGNTLAVGAIGEDVAGFNEGVVYTFTRSSGNWSLQDTVTASNADNGDRFGAAVALSAAGDMLLVGAPREDSSAQGLDGNAGNDGATDAGAAYLFSLSGGNWNEMNYIKASNTDGGDYFGSSVTLSDDGGELAVGAGEEASNATGINGNQGNDSFNQAGAVYIY